MIELNNMENVDPQEFGEVMADVRNLTESLKKYNGQISKNSEHIVELREDFIRISTNLEGLFKYREDENKQIEKLEKAINSIQMVSIRTANKLMIVLSSMTVIGSAFMMIPKFFPDWSPFMTKTQIERLIQEKTITEQSIEDIVTAVVDKKVPVIVSEVLTNLEFNVTE